jgi:hypothetical protein
MPEPITTLGLAKTTSDIIKNALDFAREQKNTNLAEKLVDLYRDFVPLMETNQELRKGWARQLSAWDSVGMMLRSTVL